jgi:UDP-N-acetylglucosamine 2-epimerase (non-hydrolysing)
VHKIAIVVGTRPKVIKLAPVIKAIREDDRLEPYVISTRQQFELLKKALDSLLNKWAQTGSNRRPTD